MLTWKASCPSVVACRSLSTLAKLRQAANEASVAWFFIVELSFFDFTSQRNWLILQRDHVVFSALNELLKT